MNSPLPSSLKPHLSAGAGLCLVALMALSGCATRHQFVVGARHDPAQQPSGGPYRLVLVHQEHPEGGTDAGTRQILQDVRTALSSRGMFEAPVGVVPVIEVAVALRQDGPIVRTTTHRQPVYLSGVTNGSGSGVGPRANSGAAGAASLPQKVGEQVVEDVITVYRRSLILHARALDLHGRADALADPLWRVEVLNEDESPDLNRYTRLMTAAAMDVIGRDLPDVRQVVMSEGDARVRFLSRPVEPTS